MTDAGNWNGTLKLSFGLVVYSGPGGRAEEHRHHAVQIIESREGPFRVTLEDGEFEARAALIPSGVPHAIDADTRINLALVEPEGSRGSALQQMATEFRGQDLIGTMPELEPDAAGALASLLPDVTETSPAADSPVTAALAYIEEALDGRPNLEQAAAAAHISPSRLTHLFSGEVGLPFRSYILWARIKRMVQMVSEGDNLTQAAHGAGFSDSSHLSRVFRSNFGLAPSALLHMELTADWPDP